MHAADDVERFGGGFDVRASTAGGRRRSRTCRPRSAASRPSTPPTTRSPPASPSCRWTRARSGAGRAAETYPVRGLDDAFLGATTFGLGGAGARLRAATATSGRRWRNAPGWRWWTRRSSPRRDNFNFAALPSDFRLSGFYLEDSGFAPVPVEVRDPQTGGACASR